MVEKDELLSSKYSGLIENLNKEKEESVARRSVELFFSFDIVNSSAYKTINYTGWYKVIILLFKKIQSNVTKMMPAAEMWRVLGDEIIFIIPVKENKDFFVYTDKIFEILNIFVYQLNTGEFFNDLDVTDDDKSLMKMQNIISLKAAAWIAIVGEGIKKLEQYDNLLERYKLRVGYGVIEFLGNDIDAGFRLKKETQDRRLVISFELAYILAKDTEYLNNLNIITYKSLKGIWQNRLYPIIWYHDSKFVGNVQFEDSFYYDEKEKNALVEEYFSNRTAPLLNEEMYKNAYEALSKILLDQNLKGKIEKMNTIIQLSQNSATVEGNLLEPQFFLRLHCVVVCYDESEMKILIMKRASSRKRYSGQWEFGCAKGTLEMSLCDQIEREYYEDFGVKIKVICDNTRTDIQPIPLALYEVDSEQGKDKGFISLAKIVESYEVSEFKESTKHSQVKWITKEEVDEFKEEAVKDFKNTLKLAFRKMEEISGSK